MIINQIHKKIVKGGGGDLSDLGTTVKVQATDNFSVGDTFVGTAISGMTPTVVRVASGLANVGHISADGSVAISKNNITSTSTYATIYIKNGDVYTEVTVPLPDMTGATTCTPTYGNKTTSINEDGSIIILNMVAFLLKISVAKESVTATADRIELDSVDISKYPYTYGSTTYELTKYNFSANNVFVRGSYLFFPIRATYLNGTTTKHVYGAMYGRIVGSSITNEHVFGWNTSASNMHAIYCSGVNDYGENDLIFACIMGDLYRLEIFGGDIVKENIIEQNLTYITQNGRYCSYSSKIFEINQETGTCSQIYTTSNSVTVLDETGEYYMYSGNCYRASDNTSIGKVTSAMLGSSYFKIVDDSYICNGMYVNTLVPSEGAEYTIAHAKSTSIAGDIYGVISDEMTVGEIKNAQKLFNA